MTNAGEQAVVEYLPDVRYVARRIHERLPQRVEMDDLVSAGVCGLIDAFGKFDHSRNVQFRTYAQFRIRGAILDSLRELDWSPRELRRKGRAVEEATLLLTQREGRAPLESEIAEQMEMGLHAFQQLLCELKGLETGSLQAEGREETDDHELDSLQASPLEDPLFQCMQGEMKQILTEAIESLPEKERLVLKLYYFDEVTMREIGTKLGVVESRVSQIKSAAVTKLRGAMGAVRLPSVQSQFQAGA